MKRKPRGCLARLVLWIILVCALLWGAKWGMMRLFPQPYGEAVRESAAESGVSPALLYAVMKAESNFDPAAVSQKGAQGLMQMMPGTGAWCAEKMGQESANLEDPEENIRLGAYYLGYLLSLYGGDETCAIAAYNAGQGRVDGWLVDARYSPDGKTLSKIPFPETEKYVKKVMLYKRIYERKLGEG